MKILFCLPGKNYSGKFLMCWSELLAHCIKKTYKINIIQRYDGVNTRNLCLGGDPLNGVTQKPYDGKVDYDYIMWIDNDVMFKPQHFESLLDHDVDIVSGVYPSDDGKSCCILQYWDEDHYKKHGVFKLMSLSEVNSMKNQYGKFPVVATGLGFILIKRGVFESMEYPWFKPDVFDIKRLKYLAKEDFSWCIKAANAGYKVIVDPNVILQREKVSLV